MTSIDSGSPSAFEFKILRSQFGSFRNPIRLRVELEEEARFGWDLFEKLDDSRLRLRRGVECRSRDSSASGDPYRTYAGMSPSTLIPIIIGTAVAVALLMVFLVARFA